MKQGGWGRQGGRGRPAAPTRLQVFSERSGRFPAMSPSDQAAFRGPSGPHSSPFRANPATGAHRPRADRDREGSEGGFEGVDVHVAQLPWLGGRRPIRAVLRTILARWRPRRCGMPQAAVPQYPLDHRALRRLDEGHHPQDGKGDRTEKGTSLILARRVRKMSDVPFSVRYS